MRPIRSSSWWLAQVVAVMIVLPSIDPRADDQHPLTPEEVVASAQAHHPRIKAFIERQAQVQGEQLSAEGAFDPAIISKSISYLDGGYSGSSFDFAVEQPLLTFGSKLFAGYRSGRGSFPIYDDYYETNRDGETRLGVELPLLRNRDIDERRAKIATSAAKSAAASHEVVQSRNEIRRDALQSYWTWVAAGQRFEVQRDLVAVAEKRNTQLEIQVGYGDLAAYLITDNQRALLKRRSELLKAAELLRRAELQVSLFLFDGQGGAILPGDERLPKSLPEPLLREFGVPEDRIKEAMTNRPELKAIDEKLRAAAVQQSFARNQFLPEVNAMLATANDHGSGDPRRDEVEIKGGFEVKIPLRMRKARGMVDSSDAAARELTRIRSLYAQKIDRDVRKALVALGVVVQRIDVERAEVRAAEELESGERIRFTQGDSNLIFVNLREQTTADARLALIDAILDYHVYSAELAAALGNADNT